MTSGLFRPLRGVLGPTPGLALDDLATPRGSRILLARPDTPLQVRSIRPCRCRCEAPHVFNALNASLPLFVGKNSGYPL